MSGLKLDSFFSRGNLIGIIIQLELKLFTLLYESVDIFIRLSQIRNIVTQHIIIDTKLKIIDLLDEE